MLKRRLRAWRRKLSSVRNYDVFLELIEKESLSRGRSRREQLGLVRSILQARRLERSAKVKKFLEGISADSIAVGLGFGTAAAVGELESTRPVNESDVKRSVIEAGVETPVIDEQRVADYAAERLDQRLAEFQALAAQSHPTNNPAELHQLRIAAKRVRYLLEIVTDMGFGDATRALIWLRTLQDRIGDWHDLEALEEEIIQIVSSGTFMKQHLGESGQMLQAAAHLQKKKEILISRLFPVRVPRYIEATSRRIGRALRRNSVRNQHPHRRGR
jgi:CHAD domain-containing protein